MKKKKVIDEAMLELGEGVFWDEFKRLSYETEGVEDRYVVWDTSGEVVMFGVRFMKERKKVKV